MFSPLLSRDIPVKPNEQLKIGVVMRDWQLPSDGTTFVCAIRFFNATNQFIEQEYKGAFHSNKIGSFIHISPTLIECDCSWSQQTVTVPTNATRIVLSIFSEDHDVSCSIGFIQCVEISQMPIFGQIYEVRENQAYNLKIIFKETKRCKNLSLLMITYFDSSLRSIEGRVIGYSYSQRYGHFKYLHCDDRGVVSKAILLPPDNAAYAHILILPLQGNSNLRLFTDPELRLDKDVSFYLRSLDWLLVNENDDSLIKLSVPSNTKKNNAIWVADLSYVSMSGEKSIAATASVESVIVDDCLATSSAEITDAVELYGTNNRIKDHRIYFDWSRSTKLVQVRFSIKNNAIVFVKKNVSPEPILHSKIQSDVVLGSREHLEYKFDVVPYWNSSIYFQFSNLVHSFDLECNVIASSESGVLGEYKATIHCSEREIKIASNRDSLECYVHSVARNMDQKTRHVIVEIPTVNNQKQCSVKIYNNDTTSGVNVVGQPIPFAYLNRSKLRLDAYLDLDLIGVQSKSALERTLFGLMQKYPDDVTIYSISLKYFVQNRDRSNSVLLAAKILRHFKDGGLRRLARTTLAEFRVLEYNWLPSAVPIRQFQNKKSANASRGMAVAVLLDSFGSSESASLLPNKMTWLREHWTLKPFAVTPLGYKGRGLTGTPYEVEKHNGTKFYHLNCVSPEDVDLIPKDSRLEFSTVLISDIFKIEKPVSVYACLRTDNLDQTLIGLALANAHRLPLVMEISDSHFNFNKGPDDERSASDFDVKNRFLEKVYRCLGESSAVIVASEHQRAELISYNISSEKIFLLPTEIRPGGIADSILCDSIREKFYEDVFAYLLGRSD